MLSSQLGKTVLEVEDKASRPARELTIFSWQTIAIGLLANLIVRLLSDRREPD